MLSHIKVLDLSTTLPGPYCTMLLARFGADVIKVERPGSGDIMREWDPWLYENININKRSFQVDLKSEEGRQIIYGLAKQVDVVIEGFRPHVVKKLGVDFETLSQLNPQLIYCSISGFGQTGPYQNVPGHDINYMGLSGALTMTGRVHKDDDEGHVQHIPYSDFSAGTLAATTILACLQQKDRKATYVDLSMTDLMFTWMGLKAGRFFNEGIEPDPRGNGEAHYGIFETKDGLYVALGVIEDHFWEGLCQYFGWLEFIGDAEYARYSQRNQRKSKILPRLREAILSKERDPLVEQLLELGVPCTPVKYLQELIDDPHVLNRQLLHSRNQETASAGYDISDPFQLIGAKLAQRRRAPKLGEHNQEILQQFGINTDTSNKNSC